MLSYLEGKVISRDDESIVLKTKNGIGFRVFVSSSNLSILANQDETVKLHTNLEVKENSFELYGFVSAEARDFFKFLTTVSGVGPNTAMSILDTGSLKEIKEAIEGQDEDFFSQAHGIGQKRSKKIIFELKSKLSDYELEKEDTPEGVSEALSALQNMGYAKKDAHQALKKVDSKNEDTETIIKAALKELG